MLTFAVAGVSAHKAAGQTINPPVLISQPTSTRAIALESVLFTSEPFAVNSMIPWSASDNRTRVILFVLNLQLQPNDDLSLVTGEGEDATHRLYSLRVESLAPVPGNAWMSAVVLRFNDELGDVGDLLVRLSYRGADSNRVRIGVGHIGGGLPDDQGAAPTPAPPYKIEGQVLESGQGLGGVTLTLTGAQTQTVVTDATGSYLFLAPTAGNYTLGSEKPFFNLSPTTRFFTNLSNHQTANLAAIRQSFTIGGIVRDDGDQGLDGILVSLNENNQPIRTATTSGGGNYSFTGVPAGFNYSIGLASPIFSFPTQSVNPLGDNATLNFAGTRRTYNISGRLADSAAAGLAGITVNLSGFLTASTTTDSNGNYSFNGLPAGRDHTVTPVTNWQYSFSGSRTFTSLQLNQTADFAGTLRFYTVSGWVQLGPSSAPNFVLPISGSQTTAVTTDDTGHYSISLPAGGNYNITPSLLYYTFAPATHFVTTLSSDQINRFFIGTRQTFTISGRLQDQEGNGLAGLTINLTGASLFEQWTRVTDQNGHYSFAGLTAGHDYALTPPSTASYTFSPHTITDLRNDETLDFVGLRRLILSGKVRDQSGNGLLGVTVTLAGSENGVTTTAANGTYSLVATATGNYSVTPFIPQGWYAFTPASTQFNNLSGAQTADFSGTLAPIPDPFHVLEFDGSPKTVDYSTFWQPDVDLGHFYWEFWAAPGPGAGGTYMLSDGYGGAHALLFGFGNYNSGESNRYQLLGNIFDGVTHENYFGSDQGPAIGEWGHFAVGWDGQGIVTYFNGVPVGKAPFAGPRRTPGPGGGGGRLLIGGSDHSNFDGRIAQVRGYEDANPREGVPGGVEASFVPETVFPLGGSLLSYFFRPGPTVADLSGGYNGVAHTGTVRGTLAGILFDCGGCPAPQFVIDPSAPHFPSGTPPAPVQVPTPAAIPGGALVFDSFSRPNSTYLFGASGGLGSTEGGTEGPQVWQTSQDASSLKPFGVLNGRGVLLGNTRHLAWVNADSPTRNLLVSVDRKAGPFYGCGYDTGLSFRVVDSQNYFFAYTNANGSIGNPRVLTVGYFLNNQRTNLVTGLNMPATWTSLKVISMTSGEIQVFADDTLIHSTNNNLNSAAGGVGLYNNSAGLGLVNRWDNFAVFALP